MLIGDFTMHKKSTNRFKKRNEIRFHSDRVPNKKKKIRHPKYIWREHGNVYDYHSITHSQYVDGIEYKKLRKNPQPGKTDDAYYNPNSESDLKSSFGKRLKWKLHPEDVKDILENKK